MFHAKNFVHEFINLRGSCLIVLIVFFIQIVSSNKFNSEQFQHKTKVATEKVNDLNCYFCDFMNEGDDCVNANRTRQLNLSRKCSSKEMFCVVKRFSYTMSDKSSTSEKRLWSLQRDCTDKCENGCIVIGERTKLYACSSCCNTNWCNTSSKGNHLQKHPAVTISVSVFMALTTAIFTHNLS